MGQFKEWPDKRSSRLDEYQQQGRPVSGEVARAFIQLHFAEEILCANNENRHLPKRAVDILEDRRTILKDLLDESRLNFGEILNELHLSMVCYSLGKMLQSKCDVFVENERVTLECANQGKNPLECGPMCPNYCSIEEIGEDDDSDILP